MALLDGKALSIEFRETLKDKVSEFTCMYERPPGLATVLVGNDPASNVYIKRKGQACEKAGITSVHQQFSSDIDESKLIEHLQNLNQDSSIDGILLQLPLPEKFSTDKLLNLIDPSKDVDGFHEQNVGKLMLGKPGFVPCTPLGVMRMLEHHQIDIESQHCVVIGRSNIVGKPMAQLMLQKSATVTICHSRTRDIPKYVKQADIVVAAVGIPHFVKASWIKPGAIVVDVGINRLDTGQLVGDVDFLNIHKKCSWITPVPGGVGPLTIAMLLENTLFAAHEHEKRKI